MPLMEEHLRSILSGKKVSFGDKKAFHSSPWVHELHRVYKALGGILEDFPLNVGGWDVFLDQQTAKKELGFEGEVRIELDEEQHFNRYRLVTLDASFYPELAAFPLNDYRHYCRSHEDAALHKGGFGGYWTNKSAEKQFGPAGPHGILDGDGAPRWKQRAFYDMVKDLASLVFDIPLARISVWDEVRLEDGTTENVRSILKLDPGQVSSQQVKALKGLVRSRLSAVIPRLKARKKDRVSHIEKMPYIALQEIVAQDTMKTEDDIRRRDFVYFERIKKGEILMRLVPRGALLLALHKENRAVAVISSKEAQTTVPHAALYTQEHN